MPKKTSKKDVKGRDTIHPLSRKVNQLHRSQLRQEKLANKKSRRISTLVFPLLDRISWFQMALEPEANTLDMTQIHSMIKQFLSRFDEEMEQLKKEQRPGRPKAKKLDELEFVKKSEKEEYEKAGFQIPNLISSANISKLKVWDGTKESLDLIELVRVRSK